ncbi:hypothetical protein HB780_05565 (plasmid) [Rhizobium lusitanum]|uniref:hypothetical protein n=1 Tax=Rhizobium lusitanum TaxID=293958 RepID=UPI00160D3608|nr:hypothetical protein [Rhizobium lusitanum]QND45223.1 hypothetical protein HB780_05565 [Rhizobium lusitanum]
MTRVPVYGQPKDQWGRVMGMISVDSPRQAMLMEAVLVEAMKRYAGRSEETLLAKWHGELVHMRERAAKAEWRGWEDDYPVEPRASGKGAARG